MKKATVSKRKKDKNVNLSKQFMLSACKVIAQKVVEKKVSNNGWAPWGYASELLKQGREIYPKMSMQTINNYIKVLEIESKEKKIGCTILFDNEPNDLSSITDGNLISTANCTTETVISKTVYSNTASSNIDDDSDASTDTSSKSDSSSPNMVGGRPKGSTIANSLDCKARIEAATINAVREFEKHQAIAKQKASRLKKGQLTVIIADCKSKHDVEETIDINAATIRQRMKRNTVSSLKGTK